MSKNGNQRLKSGDASETRLKMEQLCSRLNDLIMNDLIKPALISEKAQWLQSTLFVPNYQ